MRADADTLDYLPEPRLWIMGVGLPLRMFLDVMCDVRRTEYILYNTCGHQGSSLSLPSVPGTKRKARRRKECSYVTETGFYFFDHYGGPPFA